MTVTHYLRDRRVVMEAVYRDAQIIVPTHIQRQIYNDRVNLDMSPQDVSARARSELRKNPEIKKDQKDPLTPSTISQLVRHIDWEKEKHKPGFEGDHFATVGAKPGDRLYQPVSNESPYAQADPSQQGQPHVNAGDYSGYQPTATYTQSPQRTQNAPSPPTLSDSRSIVPDPPRNSGQSGPYQSGSGRDDPKATPPRSRPSETTQSPSSSRRRAATPQRSETRLSDTTSAGSYQREQYVPPPQGESHPSQLTSSAYVEHSDSRPTSYGGGSIVSDPAQRPSFTTLSNFVPLGSRTPAGASTSTRTPEWAVPGAKPQSKETQSSSTRTESILARPRVPKSSEDRTSSKPAWKKDAEGTASSKGTQSSSTRRRVPKEAENRTRRRRAWEPEEEEEEDAEGTASSKGTQSSSTRRRVPKEAENRTRRRRAWEPEEEEEEDEEGNATPQGPHSSSTMPRTLPEDYYDPTRPKPREKNRK